MHAASAPGFFARHKISRWHAVQEQPCFSGRTGSELHHTADWPGHAAPSKSPLLQQVWASKDASFRMSALRLSQSWLHPRNPVMTVLAISHTHIVPLLCRRPLCDTRSLQYLLGTAKSSWL